MVNSSSKASIFKLPLSVLYIRIERIVLQSPPLDTLVVPPSEFAKNISPAVSGVLSELSVQVVLHTTVGNWVITILSKLMVETPKWALAIPPSITSACTSSAFIVNKTFLLALVLPAITLKTLLVSVIPAPAVYVVFVGTSQVNEPSPSDLKNWLLVPLPETFNWVAPTPASVIWISFAFAVIPVPPITLSVGLTVEVPLWVIPVPAVTEVTVPALDVQPESLLKSLNVISLISLRLSAPLSSNMSSSSPPTTAAVISVNSLRSTLNVIVSLLLWLVVKAPPVLKPVPADNVIVASSALVPPAAAIVRLSPTGVNVMLSPATIVRSSLPEPDPPAVNLNIASSLLSCHVWV